MKNGQVLWPVRVALSGEEFSPWALELVYILGVEKSLERLKKSLTHLMK
jgi:glutamyl/glutaminyl-tRNA synthetase